MSPSDQVKIQAIHKLARTNPRAVTILDKQTVIAIAARNRLPVPREYIAIAQQQGFIVRDLVAV